MAEFESLGEKAEGRRLRRRPSKPTGMAPRGVGSDFRPDPPSELAPSLSARQRAPFVYNCGHRSRSTRRKDLQAVDAAIVAASIAALERRRTLDMLDGKGTILTPHEFWNEVVRPNAEDALRDPGDLRRTWAALQSMDALLGIAFWHLHDRGQSQRNDLQ